MKILVTLRLPLAELVLSADEGLGVAQGKPIP